ncbi:hypothetical protein MYAM1_000614 [Malassezia yamatoensis]|uniref:Uncharacterized protein n=1 Tax=Malassezia yamatoensis TaxID=253288 RepID=A0AAJ5YQD6_9BASI|nr:hypothetical protein MYAM1_000614 [Malassezia yamatoensis]
MRRPSILPSEALVRAPGWRSNGDPDVDDDDGSAKPSKKHSAAEMLYTILSLNFYSKALGFQRRGPPSAVQVRVIRDAKFPRAGPHGVLQPTLPGVQLMLRSERNFQPVTIWIMVRNADGRLSLCIDKALFHDVAQNLYRYSLTMCDYFPSENFGQARILSKPQNTAWGTREFRIVDPDENQLVICEERM